MPFRPELNYFYLYVQRYLKEKHGLRVERGDHQILTKAIMDKVRDQIVEADLLLGDVTSGNPNVPPSFDRRTLRRAATGGTKSTSR
jgi:hypothetical protein